MSPHGNPAASDESGAIHPETTTDLVATDATLRDRLATRERIHSRTQDPSDTTLGRSGQRSANLHPTADGFCLLDTDGHFLDANETYCRMSGYTPQELLSMGLSDVEVTGTREDTARRIREIIRTGSARFESRHRRKDGGLVDLDISASVLRANGGRLSCFVRAITDHKESACIFHSESYSR